MQVGEKRTIVARIGGALGFVCGVIGLLAGITAHDWKLGHSGGSRAYPAHAHRAPRAG